MWKAFYEFYVFLNLFHGKNVYANITRKICVKYMQSHCYLNNHFQKIFLISFF